VGVSPGNEITGDFVFQGGGHTVDYHPLLKSTYLEKIDFQAIVIQFGHVDRAFPGKEKVRSPPSGGG